MEMRACQAHTGKCDLGKHTPGNVCWPSTNQVICTKHKLEFVVYSFVQRLTYKVNSNYCSCTRSSNHLRIRSGYVAEATLNDCLPFRRFDFLREALEIWRGER